MSPIVKRLARMLAARSLSCRGDDPWQAEHDTHWLPHVEDATACLEALRFPSAAMLKAGAKASGPLNIWQAMLEEAMNGE